MTEVVTPPVDTRHAPALSASQASERIREQIASAVYTNTRKESASVEVTSLDLCLSHGLRTHVVTVQVGWNASRLEHQSFAGTGYRSDHELHEHARKNEDAGISAIVADLQERTKSQTGFGTELPDVGSYRSFFTEAHCNTICGAAGCLDGRVCCPDCSGSLRIQCYAKCDHGKHMCHVCTGTGTIMRNCTRCVAGRVTQTRTVSSWDYGTSSTRTDYVTESVACPSCYGNYSRQERCSSCQYGRITCTSCGGGGKVACQRCSGGQVNCSMCSGSGYTSLHYLPTLHIDVKESLATVDADDSAACHLWSDQEYIASEAEAVRARRQVDGLVLTTYTDLQLPYATGLVQIDDLEVPFLAAGSAYAVHDMDGILARSMEDDIRDVEAAVPGRRDEVLGRLFMSKFGREALEIHSAAATARGQTTASTQDDFAARVGRALTQEVRARARMVHGKALLIAAAAAGGMALVLPALNHFVSRKVPVELGVAVATGIVALWAHRRLRRDGVLGTAAGGIGAMPALLRSQRSHRLAKWAYGAIGAIGIYLAVSFSGWLDDRTPAPGASGLVSGGQAAATQRGHVSASGPTCRGTLPGGSIRTAQLTAMRVQLQEVG